jgi:hypothetical protein
LKKLKKQKKLKSLKKAIWKNLGSTDSWFSNSYQESTPQHSSPFGLLDESTKDEKQVFSFKPFIHLFKKRISIRPTLLTKDDEDKETWHKIQVMKEPRLV